MPFLSDHVHVARRFQRSVKIDTDLNDLHSLEGFICPKSSCDTLLTMARHVQEAKQGAFTWTGPYGSGKSSLVVAFSALLGADKSQREIAKKAIGLKESHKLLQLLPPMRDGWKVLPVIGRRANPAAVVREALEDVGMYKQSKNDPDSDVHIIGELQRISALNARNNGGLIVFVDEMGKFLEEVAKGTADLYFFQQLAEVASRSEGRLIIIGILHQSFEEYANKLSRSIRDEWTKIHGRFVDLPINAAGEEQIDLLARAVTSELPHVVDAKYVNAVGKCIRANRAGVAISFEERLKHCWPLHPVVACLLGPISRRRFGQNQRSIFGFLNSSEPHGFQDFLKNTSCYSGALFRPAQLWDYLRVNLEPAILASPDGHRWSLAVEAIERSEALGGDSIHIEISKCIALIDLFKERSGLTASFELLSTCLGDEHASGSRLQAALDDLSNWNTVIFKKYLDAFSIFSGSDFNIEQALTESRDDSQEIDFRFLRSIGQLQPIIAKRFYHATGALFWFDIDIAPVAEAVSRLEQFSPKGGSVGLFLLLVPTAGETPQTIDKICNASINANNKWPVVVGFAENSWLVRNLALDLMSLEKIRVVRPELEGDPVARREVNARITDISNQLEEELKKSFAAATWYVKGWENPFALGSTGLSFIASNITGKTYHKAPYVPNELLNRVKPSSNSVAAQKQLLRLMVSERGKPRLGISGFPAEGGLFTSLLDATGIYREIDGVWQFVAPPERDRSKLHFLWKAAKKELEKNTHRTASLREIYDIWSAPPIGLKDGLMPVFGVSFVLSNTNNLATYLDGAFRASFDDYVVDCLSQDPSRLELRWMNLSDMARRILTGLADVVRDIDGSQAQFAIEPFEVARRLVAIVDGLPNWTLRTMRITNNAKRIRDLFKQAHDPNKFLFDDIPELFKLAPDSLTEDSSDNIIELVREGLSELLAAYPGMIANLQNQMLMELDIKGDELVTFEELHARATNISQLTGNYRLDALSSRLATFVGKTEEIEGIASLAANKPPRDWVDRDVDAALIEISDLAQQFNRAEAFARVKGRPDMRHSIAVVIGMPERPAPVSREFDISASDHPAVITLANQIEEILKGSSAKQEIILAAISEVGARFIVMA